MVNNYPYNVYLEMVAMAVTITENMQRVLKPQYTRKMLCAAREKKSNILESEKHSGISENMQKYVHYQFR